MVMAKGIHLFPFRTQQLSPYTSTILGWQRPGKIDSANTGSGSIELGPAYSSLAQLVEHAAVNRAVVGSSPTGGARGLPPQGGGNPTLKNHGPLAQLVRAVGS